MILKLLSWHIYILKGAPLLLTLNVKRNQNNMPSLLKEIAAEVRIFGNTTLHAGTPEKC
jgi:hypothetical protein